MTGLARNPNLAHLDDEALLAATRWAAALKEAARPDHDLIVKRNTELTTLEFELVIRGINAQRVGPITDELINAAAITDLLGGGEA